jgi:hypothetical protein
VLLQVIYCGPDTVPEEEELPPGQVRAHARCWWSRYPTWRGASRDPAWPGAAGRQGDRIAAVQERLERKERARAAREATGAGTAGEGEGGAGGAEEGAEEGAEAEAEKGEGHWAGGKLWDSPADPQLWEVSTRSRGGPVGPPQPAPVRLPAAPQARRGRDREGRAARARGLTRGAARRGARAEPAIALGRGARR